MTEPETIPNPPDGGQLEDVPPEPGPPEPGPSEPGPVEVGPLEIGSDIGWPDTDAENATRARLLAAGAGSGNGAAALGRLGDLATWLSGVQGVSPPHEPQRPRLIVFSAHGGNVGAVNPAQAVEPDPTSPAAVFAAVADVGLRVVAVDGAPGSQAAATTRAAIETGIRVADEEIDAGTDLLAVGALGSGSATAAAVLVSVMTLVEPIKVVGLSSPLGDQAWMREVAEIRDTRLRALPHRHDVEALLSTVGGADLAAITGFLMRAAIRRTPVILDGRIVGAAALLAREISPNAVRWWQSGDRGTDPANLLALEEFSAIPLLELGLEVGDGVGAALAVPLVRAAARAANDLAVTATTAAQPVPVTETDTETVQPDTGRPSTTDGE